MIGPVNTVRLGEWQNALVMLWIGGVLLHPFEHLSSLSLSPSMVSMFSEDTWGIMLLLLASVRIGALTINGRMPRGSPIARMISAWLGATVMVWLSLAFLRASPVGLWAGGVYGVMATFEILSVFRAACDLRIGYELRK